MAPLGTRSPEDTGALERVLASAYTREDAAEALIARTDEAGGRSNVAALRKALAKVPTLTLYVPVPLTRASVAKIATWCRASITPELLLEVHVDPSAAGGCHVAWNGILHDFSLTHYLHKNEAAYTTGLDEILGGGKKRAAPRKGP